MNANNIKTYKMKYYLKGFKITFFFDISFVWRLIFLNLLSKSTLWWQIFLIWWSITLKVKICMNAIIMKTQFLYAHLFYVEVLWISFFKTFWTKYKLDLRFYGQLLSLFLTCRFFYNPTLRGFVTTAFWRNYF